MILLAALLALPTGFGAPYPRARLEGAPEQQGCYTRYRLATPDTMLQVAGFYRTQAAMPGSSCSTIPAPGSRPIANWPL